MSFDYINEAFKRLDALNEDMFDTSLTGLNSLSDFMEQDDASDIVKVIDPTAETDDAVSNSYIGKVIINCNVCHSHIFESKEDVVIDDDGIVNPDMQCPYCGEMSGFTVVGEIVPFAQEIEDDSEASDTEIPAEDTPVEPDDLIPEEESVTEQLSEGFNFDTAMTDLDRIKKFLQSKGYACKSKEAITYLWSVIDLFELGDVEINDQTIAEWYEETCRNFPEDLQLLKNVDEGFIGNALGSFSGTATANALTEDDEVTTEGLIGDVNVNLDARGFGGKGNNVSVLGGKVPFAPLSSDADSDDTDVAEGLIGSTLGAFTQKAVGNLFSEDTADSDELTESIDELSLTANGTHIEVDEDENGKVMLVAEPIETAETTAVISPVSDETIAEIEGNNDPEDDTSMVDFDIDEVDEESLDELGESYLKNIYENVNSFKTTSVSTSDSTMIVEGVITFNSGVKKNTGFIFEAYSATKTGTVKFVGKNEHFSNDARAFALTGKVSGKKLLPESLAYNYTCGEQRISGTVNKQ